MPSQRTNENAKAQSSSFMPPRLPSPPPAVLSVRSYDCGTTMRLTEADYETILKEQKLITSSTVNFCLYEAWNAHFEDQLCKGLDPTVVCLTTATWFHYKDGGHSGDDHVRSKCNPLHYDHILLPVWLKRWALIYISWPGDAIGRVGAPKTEDARLACYILDTSTSHKHTHLAADMEFSRTIYKLLHCIGGRVKKFRPKVVENMDLFEVSHKVPCPSSYSGPLSKADAGGAYLLHWINCFMRDPEMVRDYLLGEINLSEEEYARMWMPQAVLTHEQIFHRIRTLKNDQDRDLYWKEERVAKSAGRSKVVASGAKGAPLQDVTSATNVPATN